MARSKAGRKRVQNRTRYKCGKLKPSTKKADNFDRGSDWVQSQRARFGTYYSSALGRAYAAGLLGEVHSEEAKRLLDAGSAFARTYSRVIGPVGIYRCPLDRTPRGGLTLVDSSPEQQERDLDQQRWLYAAMEALRLDGSRPWLDQLLHANYTDSGPHWLDAHLAGNPQASDHMLLKAALRALDVIAPPKQRSRILVA